jgi:hypothetical protein
VALRNKDCRMKELRENEFAVMLNTNSKYFLSFLLSENMTVEM